MFPLAGELRQVLKSLIIRRIHLIRKAIIVTVALMLISMVYGCITINQIAPSGTAPATPPPADTTTPGPTTVPTTVPNPPLTRIPSITTLPPFTPLPPVITEDCINFNYVNTTTQNSNGKWLVVSGASSLLNFEGNQSVANLAVNIIKFYAMDRMCFVGHPVAPMMYFLSSGSSPAGAYPGEDCISLNPSDVSVQNVGGNWNVVEGNSVLINFGTEQGDANTAAAIIKKYGFTRMCFVAKPNPSMTYFRK
jgi:hypothetical protein